MLLLTVEGHSIYIRNLPLNVTVSQLEAEFQKFGAIKPNGVQVRSNKVCFTCYYSIAFFDLNIALILTFVPFLSNKVFVLGSLNFKNLAPCKVQLRYVSFRLFSFLLFLFSSLVLLSPYSRLKTTY